MNRILVASISTLMITVLPGTARSDTVEKQFDDLFRQHESFSAYDKKNREEGYVLQRFYDPAGEDKGQLSFGGGPDPEPIFGAPTNFNFGGRDFEDPEEGGILNLRLKF